MKNLSLLLPLIVLLCCCKTQTLSNTSSERIVHGYTYDKVSGEGLNGTFVYNLTKGMMTVADSIGRFKLKVNEGDSIRFKFVGMKDSVIIVSHKTPSYLQIGLDTANTTLIGNKVLKSQLLDQTIACNKDSLDWMIQFPSNEHDRRTPFYYFNNEWIPGANISMVCADSITNMEAKKDEYANSAIFVTLPTNLLDTLKTHVKEVYKDIWSEYEK